MKKFYLGMDIGTNSAGVACTDENYSLLRAKGKDCWAVRLFDESTTGEKRRAFRTARRRLERRKQRIKFLQALFAPFIEDKNFFIRLNNSQYYPEDKAEILGGDKNTLFADGRYTDKNFHSEYPTVYHLRQDLQVNLKSDLRLYYLALHHVIKYRGHFLLEGGINDVRNADRLFSGLNAVCEDLYGDCENVPYFSAEYKTEVENCLLNGRYGLRDKQLCLENLFGKTSLVKEIIKGVTGGKISPKTLFGEEYSGEKSFSFKDVNDDTFAAMQPVYGENFVLLEKIRALYSFYVFEKLLSGQPNISSAMIKVYLDHRRDLKQLKSFLRANASQEVYKTFFKSAKEKANYVNYVGFTKKGGDKIKVKPCNDADFFAALKKLLQSLENVKDSETLNEILFKIDAGSYLPKIIHSDNGLIPHQLNEDELLKIVANMVEIHPETKQIADKILTLFRFRIPYYVGPLTGKNSWVVKLSDEKITPWNFDGVVDKPLSNEAFMRRMTNKCTYLKGEDVLPQGSVIYQKYDVLNQINKLRINDVPISVPLKKQLFEELFLKRKKVTDKNILDFLVRYGYISESQKSEVSLSGKDGQFKASMSSYVQLKSILGDFVDRDLQTEGGVCENVILWHALNTDKSIVAELILKNYANIPEITKNLSKLKGLSFQGFGRFSKRFLTDLRVENSGEYTNSSILDLLYETNENLNEILFSPKYGFPDLLKAENGEDGAEITYNDVENLYVSPAVRRGIWQSLCMADEYVTAIGKVPDKIFIEVTREDGTKGDAGRKESRKSRLLSCYKNIEGFEEIAEELKREDLTDERLRQERLYLYFRQLGKCMYSGDRIDLSKLNTDMYDVDHILPRTYIKDDSLDNKVLVLRSKNAEKRDVYPLPQNFTAQQGFWQLLSKKQLISDLTYKRLTRTEPLTADDYNYFINRQKVITDQTVKAVAQLLQRKYPKTKIVYSKAKNVSDFRNKFDLFKCRDTNDLHHARDAYLNIVVGNVFDTCFSTPWGESYKKDEEWRLYNLKTMFVRDVAGAWDKTSLATVKKTFSKCSMQVVRYAYCVKGEFYDQTVYKHGDKGITAPRKGSGTLSDVSKYGGYKSQQTAYFAVVQSQNKKGEIIKTIEPVTVLADLQSKNKPDGLIKYFESEGLENVTVLVPKIKVKQLISYNGTPVYVTGVSEDRIKCVNAVQLFTDNRTDEYVKAMSEFYERNKTKIDLMNENFYIVKTNRMGEIKLKIDKEKNLALYNMLCSKLENKIYTGLGYFSTFKKILTDGLETFENISVAQQVYVLLQILHFFQCNATFSDLTLIGGKSKNGTLRFSKNITDSDIKIINQSCCGLSVKERKI